MFLYITIALFAKHDMPLLL